MCGWSYLHEEWVGVQVEHLSHQLHHLWQLAHKGLRQGVLAPPCARVPDVVSQAADARVRVEAGQGEVGFHLVHTQVRHEGRHQRLDHIFRLAAWGGGREGKGGKMDG